MSLDDRTDMRWLDWAMELQFLAQGGLAYTKDCFDQERFERIRQIAAEMMEYRTGYPSEYVKDVFCSETGFQTPKLDTRAAIFKEGKILLVREKDGRWALPGGWVDVNQSVYENTVKEVREEAGVIVTPIKIIAVQDRNKHNLPRYAYGICKVFVLCREDGGEFEDNLETTGSGYFGLEELPCLAVDKNTREQIEMCFRGNEAEYWEAVFD